MTVEEGSIVLREPAGTVADSLNYGWLVDPWAAEGDQAVSGGQLGGCYAPAPGSVFNSWSTVVAPIAINASAGRFPDGVDTDSNRKDFSTQAAASLAATSAAGATNIKVASTEGFRPGQTVHIGSGANTETAIIASVGTAGATTVRASANVGETALSVANGVGFANGQTITIDEGANAETAVVSSIRGRGTATITVAAPLGRAHTTGAQISGSGISITTPLTQTHSDGSHIFNSVPTPGTPNQYDVGNQ
ncbi:MAG: hypothetical protein JWM43_1147 [Acidobacteriaceae bacterium]|nr:hypothetical protein [Acidobacteriaceae bacterium]